MLIRVTGTPLDQPDSDSDLEGNDEVDETAEMVKACDDEKRNSNGRNLRAFDFATRLSLGRGCAAAAQEPRKQTHSWQLTALFFEHFVNNHL